MTDKFELRLRCAVKAGWFTYLIALVIFLIQWIMYLVLVPEQPDWLFRMWGPGTSWLEIRLVWFWFMAVYKFFLFIAAFVLIWLTLWARMLRKKQAKRNAENTKDEK